MSASQLFLIFATFYLIGLCTFLPQYTCGSQWRTCGNWSFLPPCGSRGSSSGHLLWQQVLLHNKSSLQPGPGPSHQAIHPRARTKEKRQAASHTVVIRRWLVHFCIIPWATWPKPTAKEAGECGPQRASYQNVLLLKKKAAREATGDSCHLSP